MAEVEEESSKSQSRPTKRRKVEFGPTTPISNDSQIDPNQAFADHTFIIALSVNKEDPSRGARKSELIGEVASLGGRVLSGFERIDELERLIRGMGVRTNNNNQNFRSNRPAQDTPHSASTNLAGSHPTIGKPPYPRDDRTVNKSGRTPESKGARPCIHCGSPKHWDNECKYAKQGGKLVRANFANPSVDYTESQQAYDELFYATTDDEAITEEDEGEENFRRPQQRNRRL